MKSSLSLQIASGSAKATCYILWPLLFLPSATGYFFILKKNITAAHVLGLRPMAGPVYGLGLAVLPAIVGMAICWIGGQRQEPLSRLLRVAQTEMLVTSLTALGGLVFLLYVYAIKGWL